MRRTTKISLALTLLALSGSGTVTASAAQQGDEAALLRAASEGRVDVVKTLLDRGLDVNARDEVGSTPLITAALGGHYDVTKLLLKRGADVNAENVDGLTPLMAAALGGHTGAVKLLLEHGADVNAQAEDGSTALMVAADGGHTGAVKLLLEHGADLEAKANDGLTTLMLAARGGDTELVNMLLERGADLNARHEEGLTPLLYAAALGRVEVVNLLLERGADVEAKTKGDATALMLAAYGGHNEVVSLLVEHGADVNAQAEDGATALALAARNGYSDIVELLEEAAAALAPGEAPEDSELSAMLPTLADLPQGAAVKTEGPLETTALSGYERDFAATVLVFELGSSQITLLATAVELQEDANLARSPIIVLQAMGPEALGEHMGSRMVQEYGYTPERVGVEEVGLPPIGDAAGAFLAKIETAVGDFDVYMLYFARELVTASVVVQGRSGRVALEDVVGIARLIDQRIQRHAPTVLGRELGEGVSVSPEAGAMLERAEMLAKWGSIPEAIAGYSEAQALDSTLAVSASSWNTLCWYGSLWGYAADVMTACEQAVAMTPESHRWYGLRRGNRGVARSLTGDFQGAIADFEAFVAWTSDDEARAQREGWIDALRAAESPLTPEVLRALRISSGVREVEEAARSVCLDLSTTVLTLEDLPAGAWVSEEGFSEEPEEICAYERWFGPAALQLGSSEVTLVFTVAELYSGSAAPIWEIVGVEQEASSTLDELFGGEEEGIDTVIVEKIDAPGLGDLRAGWRARMQTEFGDFDYYILSFARGRIATLVGVMGASGRVALEDLIPLAELIDQRVQSMAPSALDQETVAALVTVLTEAESLLRQGDIPEAMAAYSKAQALDSTLTATVSYWTTLCWNGSLWGHATDVMTACEQAVAMTPQSHASYGRRRGNRGVARALTGDFEGAIADFEAFVAWTSDDEDRAQRQGWIDALRAGENPLTPHVLESLREQ